MFPKCYQMILCVSLGFILTTHSISNFTNLGLFALMTRDFSVLFIKSEIFIFSILCIVLLTLDALEFLC